MDEITIEEKKYISSKQAAKLTGYAKDYVGQLCREGRVPARLIGRNWYVLETAIQDHRFGSEEATQASDSKKEKEKESSPILSVWDAPRYETAGEETAPINLLQKKVEVEKEADTVEKLKQAVEQPLQEDSWKSWFDHFDPSFTPEHKETYEEEERLETPVPIHTMSEARYDPPPEDLLPPRKVVAVEMPKQEKAPVIPATKNRHRLIVVVKTIGATAAILAGSLAIIGSGYLDDQIVSSRQASIFAGITVYNK